MDHPADLDGLVYYGRRCGAHCLAMFGDETSPRKYQESLKSELLGDLVLWDEFWSMLDRLKVRVSSVPSQREGPTWSLRACLKSHTRGDVIVGVMTICTDVDKLYDTDLSDAAWALIAPMLPAARPGGRPRKINIRAVLNAIFYLLRTGCQWRLLPREFPGWSTVYHYFQAWKNAGVWTCIQRSMYQQARRQAGRAACPSVVIMDGQSVKTTERGGIRGFDAHKRVKGRKRHILVDTFGLLIACRVEPADISDRKTAALLLGGLRPLFPNIRTVIADAGHQSRKLAHHLLRQDGWKLQIVKRQQRAFKITGLTWIVERSFAWLGRNRRLSKDYEYSVQSSETLIEIAATRLMLNRLTQS